MAAGSVTIGQSPLSAKDYLPVTELARALIAIATSGRHRLYNVACGRNFSHQQIAEVLEAAGFRVNFKANAPVVTFPQIDVSRLRNEFSLPQSDTAHQVTECLAAISHGKDRK